MPVDVERRKKQQAEYRKANAEQIAERKLLWYQADVEARRAKNAEANRKRGFSPRQRGEKAQPEIEVSSSKRFRFLNGKIYFTSKRGFSASEVRAVLAEFQTYMQTKLL